MGSIITIMILLVGSSLVIYESVKRLIHPVIINYNGMFIFAIFGVIVNLIATYFTRDGDSLNQKSVNLHMLEDVLGWIVVLIGSILIKFTNILYIDSVLSILVSIFIFVSSIKNLKTIIDLFLEKTPDGIDVLEIEKQLLNIRGVKNIHHFHVRSIDGYNNFATLHVVVDEYNHIVKQNLKDKLKKCGIEHSTIEFELTQEKCKEVDCVVHEHHHEHHH